MQADTKYGYRSASAIVARIYHVLEIRTEVQSSPKVAGVVGLKLVLTRVVQSAVTEVEAQAA
jgi:hypothetical protein